MISAAPVAETAPGATVVALRGISKAFGNGVEALRALDLSVGAGEFLALLGPSGCGKSTALRIIAGLSEPSAGSVEWPGERGDARRHDIGFVFQEATLMPWATVASNVWLPLRLAGVSRRAAAARIDEMLRLVGLAGFAEAYPRELSGGMKMRVSIARALVTRPSLLLMDEPFAALDEITRQKLNDDLLEITGRLGTTVVFVTHSVYESAYLATRIAVMAARPGRIFREISVPPGLARGPGFRTSDAYTAVARETSDALVGAIAATAGAAA